MIQVKAINHVTLIVDDLVYFCKEDGTLICAEAKTGETLYEEPTTRDRHRASPGTDPLAADAAAYGRHDVVVKTGSQAHRLLGSHLTVNSFHHQAVDDPGTFAVTGWCPDDRVIEIIEDPRYAFALGVQWHPERTGDLRVFAALNEAAALRAGLSRTALAA